MAHHDSHRHSRISSLLKARLQLEASEAEVEPVEIKDDPDLLPLQALDLPVSDVLLSEICDSIHNLTCLEDSVDVPDPSLWKREPVQPDPAVVETVVQVVDTNSHTIWQSTGTDLPQTISNPAFGSITISSDTTPASTSSMTVLPASQPIFSPTALPTSSTSLISSQSAPTASQSSRAPSASGAPTSTPLISSSSSTFSSSTSTPLTLVYSSNSSSENSSTTSSSSNHITTTTTTSATSSGLWVSQETGSATSSGSGSSTSDVQSSPGSGSGPPNQPNTPTIVGSIVGSVAGVAVLFFLLFYLLRRSKHFLRKTSEVLPSHGGAAETQEVSDWRLTPDPLFTVSALAPAFVKRWRHSGQTTQTESTLSSNPSERGFQKLSGRRIPSVLTSGGDGYGGGFDGDSPTIPEFMTTFSPRSPGSPRSSPLSHAPPPTNPFSSPLDSNYTQESVESGNEWMRPSPARVPVSSSHPIPQPQSARPVVPPGPDRPRDGNRGSRFTESLDR